VNFPEFFPKGLNPLTIQGRVQSGVCSKICNLNSVGNWKSTQWEKLFRMFNSTTMSCLNIFGHQDGLRFVFQSLEVI
jgi:hypothetical protein